MRTSESTGEPPITFFYWGKIIDHATAMHSNKALVLPLGDNKGSGPALYLEGGGVTNPRKSVFCPAWAISPLPKAKAEQPEKKKAKKDKDKDAAQKKPEAVATFELKYDELQFAVDGKDYVYMAPFLAEIAEQNKVTKQKMHRALVEWDLTETVKPERPRKHTSFVSL